MSHARDQEDKRRHGRVPMGRKRRRNKTKHRKQQTRRAENFLIQMANRGVVGPDECIDVEKELKNVRR
jgi:hypothetical protein